MGLSSKFRLLLLLSVLLIVLLYVWMHWMGPVVTDSQKDAYEVTTLPEMIFKSCRFERHFNRSLSMSDKVVIIGVSSFLGYHAALHLQGTCDVVAVENSQFFLDNMAWLRWKSLLDNDLLPSFVNLSSQKELDMLLLQHDPSTIIFIPSLLFNGYHNRDLPLSILLSHLSASLSNFVRLLSIVQSSHRHSQIVLFSLSDLPYVRSIQKGWLKCFELALSSFESLYALKTVVIKVDGVEGTLQDEGSCGMCRKVSEVMKILHKTLEGGTQCNEHELDPCCSGETIPPDIISNNSISHKVRGVILTTYFSGILDPQHPYYFLSNSFLLLHPFLKAPINMGLNVIIFHNELSEEFQNKVKQYNSNIEFVQSVVTGRTPNDKRFYLYYDYLLKNPTIDYVIMTDMRDVQFFSNPFEVMEVIGDQLYVGLDLPWFVDASSQGYVYAVMKMCYGKDEAVSLSARSHPFINAGVVGGSRSTALSALHMLIEFLNKTHKRANCNMAAVNIVFHRYFGHKLYGGYPIQSGFKAEMPGPQGVAIKHKAKTGWS